MSDHPAEHPYDPNRFPHFEFPWFGPKFHTAMYAVAGKTRAENHLITIAQDVFLACWLNDPSIRARLADWRVSVGLPAIMDDIALFLDQVAGRYGFSHRAELGRTPRPPQTPIEDLLPEWYRLQDRLYTAYDCAREVGHLIVNYVNDELQQSWLWLAFRLTHHLFQEAWERAMGITMIYQRTSYLDDYVWGPYAQPSEHTLKINDSEPLKVNRERLMAEAIAFIANLQPIEYERQDLPKGKVRPDLEDKTRRNTRWLYRNLICQESIYRIALSYHAERPLRQKHKQFPSCSCQFNARKGIERAQALLDMTPRSLSSTS